MHFHVPMLLMRTRLDIPDATFRQLKAEAALCGTKLKDLVTEFIEEGLAAQTAQPLDRRRRSRLPVIRPVTGSQHPALSNAELEDLLTKGERHARP